MDKSVYSYKYILLTIENELQAKELESLLSPREVALRRASVHVKKIIWRSKEVL